MRWTLFHWAILLVAFVCLAGCQTTLQEAADVYSSTRRSFHNDSVPSVSRPSAAVREEQRPASSNGAPATRTPVNTVPPGANPVNGPSPAKQASPPSPEKKNPAYTVCIIAGEPMEESTSKLMQSYEAFDYSAVYRLGDQMGGDSSASVSGRLESLILAGASACLDGDSQNAGRLFRMVLTTNRGLQIDPATFPEPVLLAFERARQSLSR